MLKVELEAELWVRESEDRFMRTAALLEFIVPLGLDSIQSSISRHWRSFDIRGALFLPQNTSWGGFRVLMPYPSRSKAISWFHTLVCICFLAHQYAKVRGPEALCFRKSEQIRSAELLEWHCQYQQSWSLADICRYRIGKASGFWTSWASLIFISLGIYKLPDTTIRPWNISKNCSLFGGTFWTKTP